MERTSADGHVGNQFADADPGVPTAGTLITAEDLTAHQEEIINVIEAAGITPSGAALDQLLKAIRALMPIKAYGRFETDGSGNVTVKNGYYGIDPTVGAAFLSINTSGQLRFNYTKEFLHLPIVLGFAPRKASGFYTVSYDPLGGETSGCRVRVQDSTGANVNLTTTALEIHVVAIGSYLSP